MTAPLDGCNFACENPSVTVEEIEQDPTERYFLILTGYDVRHIGHRYPHCMSQPLFQRLGCSGASDDVLPCMYDQRWRFDVTQMWTDIMAFAGLNESQVCLNATLERTPHTTTAQ